MQKLHTRTESHLQSVFANSIPAPEVRGQQNKEVTKMTEEMKIKLFENVLRLEHLSDKQTYDNRNYFEQADGAFQMLKIMGLSKEYIEWSYGK